MPGYDLDKIKYAVEESTFNRAIAIYEDGKILKFKKTPYEFSATIVGSKPYMVAVSSEKFDHGDCTCYVGQNDTLCKHMVALAIYGITGGKKLTEEDKRQHNQLSCSNRLGEFPQSELTEIKKSITSCIRYIKAYEGPSKTWFAYQDSLSEGCNRLSGLISNFPISEQTAIVIIQTLLKLDHKLSHGGVDDSDGTVGGFIKEGVELLLEYARQDPGCTRAFKLLDNQSTCFGWEEPLLDIDRDISNKK